MNYCIKDRLESQLLKDIQLTLKKLNLAHKTDQDDCALVCDRLIREFPLEWTVKLVSNNFDDYSDLINGSSALTMFHVFLTVKKEGRSFLVDPTFGQFVGSQRFLFAK